jgi:hypothetical protein
MSEVNYSVESPVVIVEEITRGVISWTPARPHEEEMLANPLYEAEQSPTSSLPQETRWFFDV